MTATIDDIEALLDRMRDDEDRKIREGAEHAERARAEAAAAIEAEDGQRKAQWWANEKLTRHRAIVPASAPSSHIEFGGVGRCWRNWRGEAVTGAELVPTEIEDDVRVVYVHLHDFKTLANSQRNGLDWQRANPVLMQKLSEIAPKAGGSAGPY